jgi:hypothetical protein
MHKGFDSRLDQAWWALRIGLGAGPFLGPRQLFQPLDQLDRPHQSAVLENIAVQRTNFMHIVGVIEMIVGLAILTKRTRLGAYAVSAWLLAIAINLVSTECSLISPPEM